jgi:hypothetical protein
MKESERSRGKVNDMKVEVVGVYEGRQRWAIARFPVSETDPNGPYRVGTFVLGGITFNDRCFSDRESAEAWLSYDLDPQAKI